MATFLELARAVLRESGTTDAGNLTSVAGNTGRLAKVVHWTADAWIRIQNRHAAWRWLRGEWQGTITAGTARYTADDLGAARFAEWIAGVDTTTLYDPAVGVSDEGVIRPVPWEQWRRRWDRGQQDQNRPVEYAISPANELCFGPIPNASYVVRGEYRKAPQVLEANGDVPEMPARFHDVIVWYALLLLAEHDEGMVQAGAAARRYATTLADLERDQLPQVQAFVECLA
jgi:hypothetical protein